MYYSRIIPRTKFPALLFITLLITSLSFSQTDYSTLISKDSLFETIKELTGAKAVNINGITDTIKTRAVLTTGNRLASEYIFRKMNSMGLEPEIQYFHGDYCFETDNMKIAPDFTSVNCNKNDHALWLCTDWGEIFKADGYNSHLASSLENRIPQTDRLDWIKAVDENIVYALGCTGSFTITTNGGNLWKRTKIAQDTLKGFIASGSVILVFKRGGILRSTDYGKNWNEISLDPGIVPIQGYFLNEGHAIVIAGQANTNGVLLESFDKGVTWSQSRIFNGEKLTSLSCPDSVHFFISTDKNKIYSTINGGSNWNSVNLSNTLSTPKKIYFCDNINGWALTYANEFFRTTDSGAGWNFITKIDTPAAVRDFIFFDQNNGMLTGLEYSEIRTTDGGITWKDETVPLLSNIIGTIKGTQYPERYILITSHSDCLLNYPDFKEGFIKSHGADDDASGVAVMLEMARTFKDHPLPYSIKFAAIPDEEMFSNGAKALGKKLLSEKDTLVFIMDLDMVGDDLIYPKYITFCYCSDSISVQLYKRFLEIVKNNSIKLNVSGCPGCLPKNADGFNNIGIPITGLADGKPGGLINPNYHKITDTWDTLNPDYIMKVTLAAILFIHSYANNPLLLVNNESGSIPFSLKLQDPYPNPFNSSVSIRFSVGKKSRVILTIYDLLGRQVALLENEELNSGEYNRAWNAENAASGIYFCKIEAAVSYEEKSFETKKIVLLK